MEKILLWGCGQVSAFYFYWIRSKYSIEAFISNADNRPGDIFGIPVITRDEIQKYEYEKIIIVTNTDNEKSIRAEIDTLDGVDQDKAVYIDEVLKGKDLQDEYAEYTVNLQVEVIKEILNATDEEVSDPQWMQQRIIKYGIFPFRKKWYDSLPETNWNLYGLQQVPEEFADFCVSLSTLKINTAMEIGVYRGRSAYFMCAVLARKNKELSYHLVDIADALDHFDCFQSVLPQLCKDIPSTSKDHIKEEYDFVFIDADHSYDASMEDYINVGQYAKILTGFHDIYAHEYDNENGGTVRMWKEVMEKTQGKHHRIYSKYPDKWMGIGCVLQ